MTSNIKTFVVITLTFTIFLNFTGCASHVVPKPGTITLEEAMRSVGQGIVEMRKAQGGIKTGLLTDEVEVVFNISATGEQGGKVYLEMSPVITTAGKAGGELTSKYTAERGNKITIKLKNIMTVNTTNGLLREDKKSLEQVTDYIIKQPETGPTKVQQDM
jgi:hypothetical protein